MKPFFPTPNSEPTDAFTMSPAQTKQKLKKLYLHFSNVGTRNQSSQLSHYKLHKLFSQTGLTSILEPRRIDIVVLKENRGLKIISFEVFCRILSKLSRQIHPQKKPSQALFEFLNEFPFKLFDSLKSQGLIDHFQAYDISLTTEGVQVLIQLNEVLKDIYRGFFPWQFKSSESFEVLARRSKPALVTLASQYDITPGIISSHLLNMIWQDLIQTQQDQPALQMFELEDLGSAFTYKKFLLFLGRVSVLGNLAEDSTQAERMGQLLQRMELSPGFNTLQLKTNKPNTNTSYININLSNFLTRSTAKSRKTTPKTSPAVTPRNMTPDNQHIELLRDVYTHYSSHAQPSSRNGLSLQHYLKILADLGVLQKGFLNSRNKLKKHDAELIFASLTRKNQTQQVGRLNMQTFSKAIEKISQKVYPDMDPLQAFHTFVMGNLKNIHNESSQSSIHSLSSPLLRPIRDIWNQSLRPYVKVYSNKGKISLDSFIKFARDFQVFPDLATKGKLVRVFNQLKMVDFNREQLCSSLQQERSGHLDIQGLLDGVALVALESNLADEPSEQMRIVLERMVNSKGPASVPQRTGITRSGQLGRSDYLLLLRNRQVRVASEPDFDSLLEDR